MLTKEALLQYIVFAVFTVSLISSGYNVGAEDAEPTCSKNTNQTSCCNEVGCSWTSCNTTNNFTCIKFVNDSSCPNECSSSPSNKTCEDMGTNKTECCTEAETMHCGFISCKDKSGKPYQGCHNVSDNSTIADVCSTPYNNTCIHPPTPKPTTTTIKPTTHTPSTPSKPHPTTQPTTTKPVNPTTAAPSPKTDPGQHFDAASFIGGIILCAGLVAIAFFGCKFYKARQERNYHTL